MENITLALPLIQKQKQYNTMSTVPVLQCVLLNPQAQKPQKMSKEAAGFDLYASTDGEILAGSNALINIGIAIKIPEGHYGRIAPRSGLAVKHNIFINAGVIDADYTGEIRVVAYNGGSNTFTYKQGERVAQLILERHCSEITEVTQVDALQETNRGESGFGSTDGSEISRQNKITKYF